MQTANMRNGDDFALTTVYDNANRSIANINGNGQRTSMGYDAAIAENASSSWPRQISECSETACL